MILLYIFQNISVHKHQINLKAKLCKMCFGSVSLHIMHKSMKLSQSALHIYVKCVNFSKNYKKRLDF